MVDVALETGGALGSGSYMRLARQPGDQALGRGRVPLGLRPAVAAQGHRELGRHPADRREAALQQGPGRRGQAGGVRRVDAALGQDLLLQGVEPAVNHRAEGPLEGVRRRQPLHGAAVDRLQPVQRRLGLGDLHLGGREPPPLGPLLEPAGEERLARAVLAADRLEAGAAPRDGLQFGVEGRLEPLQADGEDVEAPPRHGPPAEGVDDLTAAFGADRGCRHGPVTPARTGASGAGRPVSRRRGRGPGPGSGSRRCSASAGAGR